MSADLLRQAAQVERDEWGDPDTRRAYPKSSAVHIALADWLDELAAGWPWDDDAEVRTHDDWPLTLDESVDSHAIKVARAIVDGAS